jgi:hypothetical protein
MSDFTQKHHRDLMEAYASIYQQSVQEETVENIEYQEYEIDTTAILESVKHYLVNLGYASDEKKAEAMIPHLGEGWFCGIVSDIIVENHFIECVNSMIDDGYNLDKFTVDDLFEIYCGHLNNFISEQNIIEENLNEAIPLAIPAAVAAAPYVLPAIGAAAYGLKGLMDRKKNSQTDAASQRWLETGSFEARKERDPARVKASREAAQRAQQQRQQQATQTPQGKTSTVSGQTVTGAKPSGGAAAGGAPPSGPTPPKGPKLDPLQTVKDIFKAGKEFVGKSKGPISQVLGKPARERFFGTTRAGQITRGATAGGLSALDIGGKIADPSKPSLVSKLGSVGPGATGTVLQGLGNIPGIRGTSLGTGARGTGQAFRQVGREMRDQGKTTPSSSGSQGSTPIIKNGEIVGWK